MVNTQEIFSVIDQLDTIRHFHGVLNLPFKALVTIVINCTVASMGCLPSHQTLTLREGSNLIWCVWLYT